MKYGGYAVRHDQKKQEEEKEDVLCDAEESGQTEKEETGGEICMQETEYAIRRSYRQRGGEQHLHMKFAASAVSPYERHVILANECPAFVEMHAVRSGSDYDIFYRMTGYRSLENYVKSRNCGGTDILRITADVLNLIKSCEEYLLFPEYISFRTDHIFVSGEDDSLRLIYLPGFRTTRSLKAQVVRFIDELGAMRKKDEEKILKEYRSRILPGEYGIREYINIAEDLIRKNVSENISAAAEAETADYELAPASAGQDRQQRIFFDDEDDEFNRRVSGLISVKEKIIGFVENILS